MANSIDDIWRKIEAERQNRIQQQRITEQRLNAERERQRMEWVERNRIYERFTTNTSSSSSSGGGTIFQEQSSPNTETLGQSVLYSFVQDGIWKYLIHNFDTNQTTGVLSYELDENDWSDDNELSVTNKGYIITFNGDGNKLFVIDLSGEIIHQADFNDGEFDVYGKFIAYFFNENGKYQLLIYDGQVREFEFDTEMSISHYFNNGFLIYNNLSYYLIKFGSDINPILVHTLADLTYLDLIEYEFSNNFALYISDTNTNYALGLKVFNSNGEILIDYNLLSLSTTFNSSDFYYLNESDSFSIVLQDSTNSLNYILYYSSESNTISYNSFSSIDYNIVSFTNNKRVDDSVNDFLGDSQLYLISSVGSDNTNGLYYYDSLLILPIFKGDTTLRDTFEFANIEDSRSKGIIVDSRRYTDTITMLSDIGNASYDVLIINKDSGYSYNSTSVNIGDISDQYNLKDRTIYRHTESGFTALTFIDMTGNDVFGITVSNINGYRISRNSFFLYTDDSKSYYTNTQTGNTLVELPYYYTDTSRDNRQVTIGDGIRFGNIICINDDENVAQFISDNTISSTFSVFLLNEVDYIKYNINVGKDFVIVETNIADVLVGIPYTHTQVVDVSPPLIISDYPMDGSIEASDSIFGTGSSYFTNMYPGLFIMQADNVSLSSFSINGGLGADGSGQVDGYQFEVSGTYSATYSAFVKRVWDAGDPSVNHIIIVDSIEGVTRSFSNNTDNDRDMLSGMGNVTKVHYLLTSKSSGGFITNEEISDMIVEYLNIVDGQTISDSLSALNTNYTNITDIISGSIYNFTDAGSIDNIGDGGSDMYDNGNYIIPVLYSSEEIVTLLYKVNAINKAGEIVDTFESDSSNEIYFDYVYGDRYVGYTGDGIMIFDGTFSTISLGSNDINAEINDYYWWSD